MTNPLKAIAPPTQAARRAPVLMPALVSQPFDYRVPAATPTGALVEATLAGKKRVGAVWDGAADDALPEGKVRPVHRVLDQLPPLAAEYRNWLQWISDYTLAPLGAVLALAGLAHAAKTPRTPYLPPRYVPALPALTDSQQAALKEILNSSSPDTKEGAIKPILLDGVTGSGKTEVYFHAMARMLGLGSNSLRSAEVARATPAASSPSSLPRESNARPAGRASPEPTRAAAQDAPSASNPSPKQILVLLPEIALTHQWLARFETHFGAKPVLWHSQQTPAARSKAWQAVARGEARIVVGTRSALFLPFADLGLIVVDEEHDPSYKQDEGVLYHARDMAVTRARFERIPILLVSATPSLETLLNADQGKYRAVHLRDRFGAAGLPSVALVDMVAHPPARGDFLSPVMRQALADTVARGEQALLFLNRRGYAPLLLCRACGHRFQCADCSAWMVVHGKKDSRFKVSGSSDEKPESPVNLQPPRAESAMADRVKVAAAKAETWNLKPGTFLACHHCGHRDPMPTACPACQADAGQLAACGPGVERIAEEVRAMFSVSSPCKGEDGRGTEHATRFPVPTSRDRAQDLRKKMTGAEKKLWQRLRNNQMGVAFRKQHPIGPYIVDFVNLESRLIIELDGGQHAQPDLMVRDASRESFLGEQGFVILRFWNNEILENLEGTLQSIATALSQTRPPPGLPLAGGGVTIALLSSDEAVAAETWAQIERGEIDIVVGTQMVAKGHHFPRLTFVGVVDADVGLQGADLRAGERTYQLLHQLGGRAGRAELPGRVLIQTYAPRHPIMQALVAQDRDRVMELERELRRAGNWPPYGQLAAILLDGPDEAAVRRAAQALAQAAPGDPRLRVLGPAPAPLSKLRGQYRYRLLVKMQPGLHLQRTLAGWLSGRTFKGVRIKIDVNPYYFL